MNELYNIVFSESATGILKASGQKNVITILEDYSVGPFKNRTKWWTAVVNDRQYAERITGRNTIQNITKLVKNNVLVVWSGPCIREYLGLVNLIHRIKNFSNTICIIQFPPQEFKSKYSTYTARCVGHMPIDKLSDLLSYKKRLTKKDFKKYSLEWSTISKNKSGIRELHGNKICHYGEEYYDTILLSFCSNNYISSKKIIEQTLSKKRDANIEFLIYRIKHLINIQQLEYTGELINMTHVKIRKV